MPTETPPAALPLRGLRVLEFTQNIMGPSAGLVLADLGADVVKIEPAPGGDATRRLSGFAAGFFGYFNRNKRSLALDLKQPRGLDLVRRLATDADVLIENYAPGTMDRLGCGWEALSRLNPRLVYCALKGFLSGPYEHRPALDEVVQFMGGLAYMTGPKGQPLRAGTSVVDIMGGAFAVIAILAALRRRDETGKGEFLKSALFESTAFMMGQHMAGEAITGEEVPPMPVRRGGWGIYQTFKTADDDQVFVGVTSDRHWTRFCEVFQRPDLLGDPRLKSNEQRVEARPWMLPIIAELMARFTKAEIVARCEQASIPYAPVARTADLFEDPHLKASGGLVEVDLPGGIHTRLPRLPIEIGGERPGLYRDAPAAIGQHSREILAEAGLSAAEIAELEKAGVIVAG
ncbi:MAG TPA: CaiB/BaiF CoA-transferase family protein [Stellaceae bacterium]|nr:CaiB/BaiF CoA-transferase family protein [Stellaceae bacterium]